MRYIFLFLFFLWTTVCCADFEVLSECFGNSIQLPLLEPPEEVECFVEDVISVCREILQERLKNTNYDRMCPILQFLDHYEQLNQNEPFVSPLAAFKTFMFEPLAKNNRGGPCVALTYDIYVSLPPEFKPYIVLAQLSPTFQQFAFPKYAHTAVLIKFHDYNGEQGYILVDPSFDIDEPLKIVKNQSVEYKTHKGVLWRYSLVGDKLICEIPSRDGLSTEEIVYLTDRCLNPIQCSAMPMILVDRRLSLLSRKDNGSHIAHMNIELNKRRVIWDKEDVRFLPIPFSEITDLWQFPDWFSHNLFFDSNSLGSRIKRVVDFRKVLDDLYTQYLKIIRASNEFSLTGALSLEELDKTIALVEDLD